MKVLVLYHSKTGNTKKLAEEVAKGVQEVQGVGAILRSCQEVKEEDFLECKGLIAGSPVYFGSMAAELKSVFDRFVHLRKQMENKSRVLPLPLQRILPVERKLPLCQFFKHF